jgi:hypothetical protein
MSSNSACIAAASSCGRDMDNTIGLWEIPVLKKFTLQYQMQLMNASKSHEHHGKF